MLFYIYSIALVEPPGLQYGLVLDNILNLLHDFGG